MKKQMIIYIKSAFYFFLILCTINLVFFIANSLTYLIPNRVIRNNIKDSVNNFDNRLYMYPFFENKNEISEMYRLDNFTDALILITAYTPDSKYHNIFQKAVLNSKYQINHNPVESLKVLIKKNDNANLTYERYWFGILFFLKPLLAFFTYQTIRYLNYIIISLLLLGLLFIIKDKLGIEFSFIFFLTIIFMGSLIIPMSLQYTPVYIVMLVSSIIILKKYDNKAIDNQKLLRFFLIVGCFTAYLDLLSYPLVTLGIPLIFLILLNVNKNRLNNYKIILFCVLWGIGYFGSYFLKWVLASIILNKNVISSSVDQFLFRASSENIGRLDAITSNFKIFFNKFNLIFIIIYLLLIFYFLVFKKCIRKKIDYKSIYNLLLVSIMPYIWYMVLANHSYIHFWMAFRIQAITFFAISSI